MHARPFLEVIMTPEKLLCSDTTKYSDGHPVFGYGLLRQADILSIIHTSEPCNRSEVLTAPRGTVLIRGRVARFREEQNNEHDPHGSPSGCQT